jgi:hypothetical protein
MPNLLLCFLLGNGLLSVLEVRLVWNDGMMEFWNIGVAEYS